MKKLTWSEPQGEWRKASCEFGTYKASDLSDGGWMFRSHDGETEACGIGSQCDAQQHYESLQRAKVLS